MNFCLFVCYVKQVGRKQWVAKGIASIQWRGEVGQCRMNIRRGVQGQRTTGLLFLLKLLYIVYNEELAKIGSFCLISVAPVTTSQHVLCSN